MKCQETFSLAGENVTQVIFDILIKMTLISYYSSILFM